MSNQWVLIKALFFRLGIGVLVIAKANLGLELFRRPITFCSAILGHGSWAMFFELQVHSTGSDLVKYPVSLAKIPRMVRQHPLRGSSIPLELDFNWKKLKFQKFKVATMWQQGA